MPVIQGHSIMIPNPIPMDIPPPSPLGENEGSVIPVPSGSFTEISSLRNSALMLFPEEEDKKYILNCPIALKKCSFDLRPPRSTALAKYAVVMTLTVYRSCFLNKENQGLYTPTTSGLLMNQPSSFIVWNTRGANSDDFKRNFKELIRSHSPCIVALLETKMENHINLKDEFGFDDYYEVPAQGRYGGIVLFWISSMITLNRINHSSQELYGMIQVRPSKNFWWFTAIYASTKLEK